MGRARASDFTAGPGPAPVEHVDRVKPGQGDRPEDTVPLVAPARNMSQNAGRSLLPRI